MKLRPLSKNKEIWLKEFDHWVTPYLEEIKDSDIFRQTISNIKEAIELLGEENERFTTSDAASPQHITDAVIKGVNGRNPDEVSSLVNSFCDLLFLITGKTDNNYKCQFPVYIKEVLKWKKYPTVGKGGLRTINIPRVIKSENIARLIAQLEFLKNKERTGRLEQLNFVTEIDAISRDILLPYFKFILDQEIYLRSLKVFGSKYFELKQDGSEDDLLAPIIVAYVRGSASASGGHKPESILREFMNSWGLRANEDYNVSDVLPFETERGDNNKTRAFDFVLPFQVKDWEKQIFIQSQFYAGDSGSVSHKNVDQTSNSRSAVRTKVSNPKFVEYVDGAGYYGSLNGDLKKLLNMSDTENFFQVKTSPIKLRQMLQEIGFLTPLELVHALALNNFDLRLAEKLLKEEGYKEPEINRVKEKALRERIIQTVPNSDVSTIDEKFYELSRRYFLLDCLAIYGSKLDGAKGGYALVPGYDEYFGTKVSEMLEAIKERAGRYYQNWQAPEVFLADLEFLIGNKWVILNN